MNEWFAQYFRMTLMKCRRILKAMQKRKNTVTKCLEKAIILLKARRSREQKGELIINV